MKSCPACNNQYSDDTLAFCLQDGTPLVARDVETPTVVLGEVETVARAGGQYIPVNQPSVPAWQQSQVTHVGTAMPQGKGSNTPIVIAIAAVGLLVLLGIVGLAAVVFFKNAADSSMANANTNVNIPSSNLNNGAFPTPQMSPLATPTVATSTPAPTPISSPPATPPPALSSYASTTRLKFARGAYSTSYGGDVNPGDARSLVLACRSGQSLSANVSSSGGCVTFRGGGTSFRTTTNGGDNYVTVTNSCSKVVRFSVSISVI